MSNNETYAESRNMERIPTELRTIVQVRESEDEAWKEVTEVTTVTRNGAGFSLTRECAVGRLVNLVLPLPRELRAYDLDADLYPVMGLVQYCNQTTVDDETLYHVGVGFVGRHMPDSFKENPHQSYRICGMKDDGLWEITEAETAFKTRSYPRYWLEIDVTVTPIKKEKNSQTKKVDCITKNISASGVSVECALASAIGDKVKFASKEYDFYAIAIVRNRTHIEGQKPTLHLEFVESFFPVDKILMDHQDVAITEEKPSAESDQTIAEPESFAAEANTDADELASQPPPSSGADSQEFEFERY